MPVNNQVFKNKFPNDSNKTNVQKQDNLEQTEKIIQPNLSFSDPLINEIEILLPLLSNKDISKNLTNAFELTIYSKKIKNINLNINRYADLKELKNLLEKKSFPGKIFIGTLSSDATEIVSNFCDKGIIFFSFTHDKSYAKDCVYLINFFPEDDLVALFNFFPEDSKVALLYPQNYYGYNINNIIDLIAANSKSLIVNRASYNEDLTNAREAIKELGKYELRKQELNRQKEILKIKQDDLSKIALKKIERFETLGNVDFTHIIIPDYSIRLLEIAPLLPFYDVDPNTVQFVGTGVWDDDVFFDEPSLQGAIFSGIELSKREVFFNNYQRIYKEKPIRTATIPYDLLSIVSYLVNKKMSVKQAVELLNNKTKFDGIDGQFWFVDNSIFRNLDILKITKGYAKKLN